MNNKPTLIYFDVRGRAESIRQVLEEIGEPWEEQVVTLREWTTDAPATPFHRLPVYCEGDLRIPETFAILNYLALKHGLSGANAEERIRCDVTIESWKDHNQQFMAAFTSGSNSSRKHFFEHQHPRLLGDLEAWYDRRESGSAYWAGSLTIADFVAFNSIADIVHRSPDLVDGHIRLMDFHRRFAARPKMESWLSSTRRHAALFYLGADGKKLYPKGE